MTANPNADFRKRMFGQGKALPPAKGKPPGAARFPINDVEDLRKAIRLAPNDPKVHAFIKRRAAALGKSNMIPDSWK